MVNVPGVLQLYVREAQSDGTVGFGEERDEEVGAEGDGSGYGGLGDVNTEVRRVIALWGEGTCLAMYDGVLTVHDDLAGG